MVEGNGQTFNCTWKKSNISKTSLHKYKYIYKNMLSVFSKEIKNKNWPTNHIFVIKWNGNLFTKLAWKKNACFIFFEKFLGLVVFSVPLKSGKHERLQSTISMLMLSPRRCPLHRVAGIRAAIKSWFKQPYKNLVSLAYRNFYQLLFYVCSVFNLRLITTCNHYVGQIFQLYNYPLRLQFAEW